MKSATIEHAEKSSSSSSSSLLEKKPGLLFIFIEHQTDKFFRFLFYSVKKKEM